MSRKQFQHACKYIFTQIWVFTSGKFPSNLVNFWDNIKLYSASEYSFTDIIDALPLFLLTSCKLMKNKAYEQDVIISSHQEAKEVKDLQ